jgi:hypothetical protein
MNSAFLFFVLLLITICSIAIDEVMASKRFEKGVLLGYLLAQQRGIPYGG